MSINRDGLFNATALVNGLTEAVALKNHLG
jgi:hypothetical protein